MRSFKRIFKWWWGWNAERIENILERYANKGWRLTQASLGMTVFDFVFDKPQTVRFALDYQNKIDDEYMTILKDDGWVYVARSAGWILWKKVYMDERPHLFTDNQSLIDRNKRLIYFLSLILLIQVPIIMMNTIDRDYSDHRLLSIVIWLIYLPMVLLIGFAIVKIALDNKRLNREGRR